MRLARGFTLVEVLAALAIVGIGLTGNYLAFSRSLQLQHHGIYQSRATALASSTAESLLAGRTMQLADDLACTEGSLAACAASSWRDARIQDARREVAGQLPNGAIGLRHDTHRLTITVSWRDTLSLLRSEHAPEGAL